MLIVTGLIVLAMTWLVMPTFVRLLAPWLYPADARAERNRQPRQEQT